MTCEHVDISTCVDTNKWTAQNLRLFDGARFVHDQSCVRAVHLAGVTDARRHLAASMFYIWWIVIVAVRSRRVSQLSKFLFSVFLIFTGGGLA